MTTGGGGDIPRCGRAKKSGGADHKAENNSGSPGACDIFLHLSNDLVYTPLGIRWRYPRYRGDQSNKIRAIISLHSTVTWRGQKNACGLSARII